MKKYLSSFSFFYDYLGYRILVVLTLSIFVGIMDGMGLAMFLPLLEIVSDDSGMASAEQIGSLSFILEFIEFSGFELTLTVILVIMFFFFLVKGVFRFIESYFNTIYRNYFIKTLRKTNIEYLSEYDYQHFVKSDVGRIQNTMSGEVERVSVAYRAYMQIIQQLVLVIVYAGLAFLANPQFALLVAVGGLLSNFLFRLIFEKTKQLSRRVTKSNHGFQKLLIQQVQHFKYLKASGLIKQYADKLVDKVYEIERSQKLLGILNGVLNGSREPILIGIVVIVILIQVQLLGGSLGLIIISILFFYRALTSVMQIQTAYNQFLMMVGSLENITLFIQELKTGVAANGPQQFAGFDNDVQLENVSYAFNSSDDKVLKNINLRIEKNKAYALVGESGSGKTTLMNILCGLLTPTSGKMLVDGEDFDRFDHTSWQRKIGYITQEPAIFSDSIFNNVTFWAPKSPENLAKFNTALQQADILEFVNTLRDKEETLLGNSGINLSGGQKQRLSIARELYKDVDFLFMDEATSALDSETEKNIQNSIDHLKGKYTIVIIAHRLSTIKGIDEIIVLKQGSIISSGNYRELIQDSTIFKRMVKLQEL